MNNITDLMNRRAYYRGNRRGWYMNRDTAYQIIAVREDGKAVQFDNGEWVGTGSIELIEEKNTVDLPKWERDLFNEAAGGPREMIVNEIARLKARLAELETALKVIDSL